MSFTSSKSLNHWKVRSADKTIGDKDETYIHSDGSKMVTQYEYSPE